MLVSQIIEFVIVTFPNYAIHLYNSQEKNMTGASLHDVSQPYAPRINDWRTAYITLSHIAWLIDTVYMHGSL